MTLKIIDAHHHLWAPDTDPANIGYVWLKNIGAPKPFGDPTPIQRDYLVEAFRTESQQYQLSGSVHVQCDGAIPDPVRESEWLETLKSDTDTGLPSVHIGFLDLTAPNAPIILERYQRLPSFRGVRQIISRIDERADISFAPAHYLHNPIWRDQFTLLAEQGLSFDLQLYPQQMAQAAEFLSQHEKIPVVIDHAGSPYDQTKAGITHWKAGMAELAALPQVMVKLSGWGMFDKHWSADSIQPLFDSMLELFGAHRMMWGSNFPVDKLMRDYDFTLQQIFICGQRRGLSSDELARIFHLNAAQFYRINLD